MIRFDELMRLMMDLWKVCEEISIGVVFEVLLGVFNFCSN